MPSKEAPVKPCRADLFPGKEAQKPAKQSKQPAKTGKGEKPSSVPSGVLRLNKIKVYGADGLPRPKPYIYDRLKAVEGLTVEEACKLEFPDKHGQLRQYKRDIFYDVYNSQWLRIERSDEPVKGVTDHLSTSDNSQEAKNADCEMPDEICSIDHPDGMLGNCVNRHCRRQIQKVFLRSRRRYRRSLQRRPQRLPQLAAARQCTNTVRRAKAVHATALSDSPDCCEGAECEEAEYSAEPDGPHFTYFPQTEARHRSFIAMKDLPWRPYLHGKAPS